MKIHRAVQHFSVHVQLNRKFIKTKYSAFASPNKTVYLLPCFFSYMAFNLFFFSCVDQLPTIGAESGRGGGQDPILSMELLVYCEPKLY